MEDSRSAPELLAEQFYTWELRGRGWIVWPQPVDLEPPFRPFFEHSLPRHYSLDDGRAETGWSRFGDSLRRLLGGSEDHPLLPESTEEDQEPTPEFVTPDRNRIELQISLPSKYQPSREIFEQCLSSLSFCKYPLSFEVVGNAHELVTQITSGNSDAEFVSHLIKAHFPEAIISRSEAFLLNSWYDTSSAFTNVVDFGLNREWMIPLQSMDAMAIDPLVAICGSLERLKGSEVASFQVLFKPVRARWTESMLRAVTTEDGEPFFVNAPELTKSAMQKAMRPLFATVVRVGARTNGPERNWELIKGLSATMGSFGGTQTNSLIPLTNDNYPLEAHSDDLVYRQSRRSGMLLNSDELASLAHLPTASVRSQKLRREIKRTKAAPDIAEKGDVLLGENHHEGETRLVGLKSYQRVRHTHLIGASGTGKSTLLLNLIVQDIRNGEGLAVLDPHGDLIDQIIGYIPEDRFDDVILLDPSDEEFPIGLNILSAQSDLEKNLLASDLVSVFQRLSTSWGDQMTSVLGNAILAFLESKQGGSLPELRRFFIDREFRETFLETVTDPEIVYYWKQEFPLLKSNSLGPLLTRLDTFLRPKTIRYMVGQKENRLNFGRMMNEGKIFLAKLPQGLIGEENTFLLGSLLVSKFQQLAISRQQMEARDRRPFWLYVDEFHHFITPTMATILSGARKYQLGLLLAHQELRQLQRNSDVASAVLGNTYTRICFRVGDEDARKLAEGFSFFEAEDLQNLGIGEAICRIERAQYDFNIATHASPDERSTYCPENFETIRSLSRERYSTPRKLVEEELAKLRSEPKPETTNPFAKRAARVREVTNSEPPKETKDPKPESPTTPPTPDAKPRSTEPTATIAEPSKPPKEPAALGVGGIQHQTLQQRLKTVAESLGFRANIEKQIADGKQVDLFLERGEQSIACEVAVTSPLHQEVNNVLKCIKASIPCIVVTSPNEDHLRKVEAAVRNTVGVESSSHVHFMLPDDFITFLQKTVVQTPPPKAAEEVRRGYKVKRAYVELSPEEMKAREQAALKVMTKIKRAKG